MLNIVSIGHAYPDTVLDNDFLSTLPDAPSAAEILAQSGIKVRYSSLSKDYITSTLNADTGEAKKQALQTPTEMGVRAAEMALEKAGLSWEDIGLILGDGMTPVQTTPGESQRVGQASGLKIPAYDLFTSSAGFALTCHTLNSWKKERTPDYVLSVSTHTPTQLVDYSKGHERFVYGDGASAVIFSSSNPGIFSIEDSVFKTDISAGTFIKFNILGHAYYDKDKLHPLVIERTSELYTECVNKNKLENPLVLLSTTDGTVCSSVVDSLSLNEDRVIEIVSSKGNLLSAGTVCALSEQLPSINSGEQVVCALAKGAVSFGYVLLKRN